MSRNKTRNTTAGMIGLALTGLVLSGSAFATQPLAQGYMVVASHATAEGKCGEGKCGEGKCGDTRLASADTDKDAPVSRAEFLANVPSGGAPFAKQDANADGANGKALPRGLSRLRHKR